MNDVQETLSRIWLRALGETTDGVVGGADNFFEQGGDSASAISLYTETEEQLQVKIEPTEFLGTLAEGAFDDLVKLVEQAGLL